MPEKKDVMDIEILNRSSLEAGTGEDNLKSSAKKRLAEAVSDQLDKPNRRSKKKMKKSRANYDVFD